MSKDIDSVIEYLVVKIDEDTQAIAEKKRTVNSLCKEAKKEPLYPEAELTAQAGSRIPSIRSSQFYGKTPTIGAREYLDLRNEAVPLEEILDALQRGGFDFEAQGWTETMRLKNLGISMGKNSSIFHRLPNDTWGLLKWYPNVKQPKKAAKENGKTETVEQGAANSKQPEQATEAVKDQAEETAKTANAT